MIEWLKRVWCNISHERLGTCKYCTFEVVVELRDFDWLRDYGPMWEPATTAFWLAPNTEAEVESWYRKYRPEEVKPKPHPLQNAGNNQVARYRQAYEYAFLTGCDQMTLNALYDQYRNAALREQNSMMASINYNTHYNTRNNLFKSLFG